VVCQLATALTCRENGGTRFAHALSMNHDNVDHESLLDPKNDLVFKIFLQDEMDLLRSLIGAVLNLPGPIRSIRVLNPELLGAVPSAKRVVLDIRLEVAGLGYINVEMQRANVGAVRERFLYYWSKQYVSSLKRGENYSSLVPVISILWLDHILTPCSPYHSIYTLREQTTGELYSNHLELHTLELPKYKPGIESQALEQWSTFFSGSNE
jgi:predicted transposase/invertase (TIGR01784 family)